MAGLRGLELANVISKILLQLTRETPLGCTTITSGYNFRKGPDIALLLLLHYRMRSKHSSEFAVTRLIAPLSIELIFRPRLGVARQHASQI